MPDERAYFFAFEKKISLQDLHTLDGKALGDRTDGEYIHTRLVDFDLVGCQPVFSAQVGAYLVKRLLESRGHQAISSSPSD